MWGYTHGLKVILHNSFSIASLCESCEVNCWICLLPHHVSAQNFRVLEFFRLYIFGLDMLSLYHKISKKEEVKNNSVRMKTDSISTIKKWKQSYNLSYRRELKNNEIALSVVVYVCDPALKRLRWRIALSWTLPQMYVCKGTQTLGSQ